jgi:flagellar biosynthesis/type III secretory pathway protein FliH
VQEFAFEDFTAAPPVVAPGLPGVGIADPAAFGAAPPVAAAHAVLDAVAEARAEADEIRAAAYAEGHAAGREEALVTATGAAEALAQAALEAHAACAERAAALEHDAVELALALAEKIVGATLAVRPELVLDAVRTALRGIVERERLTVLVNPADLDLVSEAMAGIRRELGGIEHVEVQAERRVASGGAVVRHAAGELDARVETRLERAREVVEAALAEAA